MPALPKFSRPTAKRTKAHMTLSTCATDLLEREPALLCMQRLQQRASAGQGGILLLTGEAGLGKSSVLRHWARELDGGSECSTCSFLGRRLPGTEFTASTPQLSASDTPLAAPGVRY